MGTTSSKRSARGFCAFQVSQPGATEPWTRTSLGPDPRRSTCTAQSLAKTRLRSGFLLLRALVCSPRVVEPARPSLQLAGAGGTLIGVTAACGILGAVGGWLLGSWPVGLMVGLVAGIPAGIFAV